MIRVRPVVYMLSTDDEDADEYGFPTVIHAGEVDVFVLDYRLLEVSSYQDLVDDITLAERALVAADRLTESDARKVLAFLDGFLERARRLLGDMDRAREWLGDGGGPAG